MSRQSSAILPRATSISTPNSGLGWGFLGVLAFSFTLPFTHIAVGDGAMSPLFVGAGRAVLAGVLAALVLLAVRPLRPRGLQWLRLAVVAGGVVLGFPMLTSYALVHVPASHGAVVIALLPAATAVVAVLRTREHPGARFWIAAGVGAVVAVGFALVAGGGFGGLHLADLLLFGAVVAGALGYAEGGVLSRELGSWQTICWALVLVLPVMSVLTGVSLSASTPGGGLAAWASFLYLGVVSMFLGFFAWYRGLAIGPMVRVSQIQLAQPVMTLVWAALLLGEDLTVTTVLGGLLVVACALVAVRSRQR